MRRKAFTKIALAGASLAAILPSAAQAQSDVVVMRRVLAPPTRTPTPAPTSQPGDPDYYSWRVSAWSQTGTCGQFGTETRNVACVRTDGTEFPDSYCTSNGSGRKPVASQSVYVTQTCGYAWTESGWSSPTTTCGTSTITRDVTCIRSDGTVADPSACAGPTPPTSQSVSDTSGCSYAWTASEWSAPQPACGDAVETRAISCLRSDGAPVAATSCVGAPPSTSQSVYSSCGASPGGGSGGPAWSTGDWGAPVPGCGATVAQRTVVCQDGTGTMHPDADCTGAKPAATEPATDYSTCTDGRTADHPYGWTIGAYGAPSTTCGAGTQTRQVVCTDNSGAVVDDAQCVSAKPATTIPVTQTSGCSYAWATGDFGAPQPACGATVATRAVFCRRSDGTGVIDEYCGGQPEPSTTEPATDTSACTFGWTAGSWSDPSTSCGTATETRAVTCQRATGTTAADAECDATTRPPGTQSSYETSGCGVSWKIGDWKVTPACGSTPETRDVTCLRSDGQTVDDAQCSTVGAKPATTQETTDLSTCTFSWAVGAYPDPSSTCGTTTQTRSVTCVRSDGQTVDDTQCGDPAAKPAASETTTQTSGCTYAWSPSDWAAATPACGASTHSRTVNCARSDHVAVDLSFCAGAGTEPATSEATTDYSTCSYKWYVSDWQGAAGCGDTVTQTRTVYCQRSDGTQVADGLCGDASGKPASTQPITDYSQCTYAWNETYGTWSDTCSATATRTNSVTCVRQDGQVMQDTSYCPSASKPATTDTGNYAGCTYAGTYGAPLGVCSATSTGSTAGTQTTTLTKCTRSDGTDYTATNASSGYSKCSNSSTQSCTVTYAATYGSWGTCVPSSQGSTTGSETGTMTACRANDGTTAPLSACTNSGSPSTSTRACSGITYAETYGAYGTCSGGTQSAPIASCTTTASDGNKGTVATSLCPASASSTTTTCGSNLITNGTFSNGFTSWTSVNGATNPSPTAGNPVAQLNSPTINTTSGVWQSVNVISGHRYTLTFSAVLPNGSYCAVPLAAYIETSYGGTALATYSSTFCSNGAPSLSWTSDRTGAVVVAITARAQASSPTSPQVDNVVLTDLGY